MTTRKPIRVYYTQLGEHGTFWATQHYKETIEGNIRTFVCTGQKWDVTQDIAQVIVAEEIEFRPKVDPS